jgi:hypothetical protein
MSQIYMLSSNKSTRSQISVVILDERILVILTLDPTSFRVPSPAYTSLSTKTTLILRMSFHQIMTILRPLHWLKGLHFKFHLLKTKRMTVKRYSNIQMTWKREITTSWDRSRWLERNGSIKIQCWWDRTQFMNKI